MRTKSPIVLLTAAAIALLNYQNGFGQSTAGYLGFIDSGKTTPQQNQISARNQAAINTFNAIQQQTAANQQAIQNAENQILNTLNQQNQHDQQNQQTTDNSGQTPPDSSQSQNPPAMATYYRQAAQAYYDAAAKEANPATASCDRAWGDYYTCVADSFIAGVQAKCIPPNCQPGSGQAGAPAKYIVNGQVANQSQFQQSIQQQIANAPAVSPPLTPEPAYPLIQLSSFFEDTLADNPLPAPKTAPATNLSWITQDPKKTDSSLAWIIDATNKPAGTNGAATPDVMKQLNNVLY